jgi:hypothetical protein
MAHWPEHRLVYQVTEKKIRILAVDIIIEKMNPGRK